MLQIRDMEEDGIRSDAQNDNIRLERQEMAQGRNRIVKAACDKGRQAIRGKYPHDDKSPNKAHGI